MPDSSLRTRHCAGSSTVCRKDEGVAHSTRCSRLAEQQPLNLTAEGTFSNPNKGKWALCSSALVWRSKSYSERGLWEFPAVRRKSAPEVTAMKQRRQNSSWKAQMGLMLLSEKRVPSPKPLLIREMAEAAAVL